MTANTFQIVYFPYLFLNKYKSISCLGINIWNAKEFVNKIENKELRKKVTSLIYQNRILGKPIKEMGIIDVEGRDNFLPLTSNEEKKIKEVRLILFLSAMAKCNTKDGLNAGHHMLTSDNFKVVYQNFKIDSPYTGYRSGVIVRETNFGYKISEIKYEKPNHVMKHDCLFDEKFLNQIEKLRGINRKFYRLILRASDSLINAYSNSEDVSPESRILESIRAFEILFNLPEAKQRMEFKEAIKKYCEPVRERQRRYLSERPKKRKVPEKGSRQVMWADRLYSLRNHIIHGDRISEKDFWFHGQLHFQLALWFFLVAVKQKINYALKNKYFYDLVKSKSGTFVYDNGYLEEAIEKFHRNILKTKLKK